METTTSEETSDEETVGSADFAAEFRFLNLERIITSWRLILWRGFFSILYLLGLMIGGSAGIAVFARVMTQLTIIYIIGLYLLSYPVDTAREQLESLSD